MMRYDYFSNVVLDWSLKHPDAKEDFKLKYEYCVPYQAFRITMEYVPYKHGVCELLDEDIMYKLVCPHDYIFAVLDRMYKTLKEDEELEKRKWRDYIRSWLIINADRHDDNIEVIVEPCMHGYHVRLIKERDGKSICANAYISGINEGVWREFTAHLYKRLKEKEKKEMDIEFARREDNDVRLKMAKAAVVAWYNEHNQSYPIGMDDVYIVWFCKTLQNWKALAGTHHGDGMYYEVTYDGDKYCAYVDAYKKWQNVEIPGSNLIEIVDQKL